MRKVGEEELYDLCQGFNSAFSFLLDWQIQKQFNLNKKKYGFMTRKETVDAILVVKGMQEE